MKELLMCRGGIVTAKRKLADGAEHTLHFKAKTPTAISIFVGHERRQEESEANDAAREKRRAEFIASSLCDEGGGLLMSVDEAMMIPVQLKHDLCWDIIIASNETEAGKGLPPGAMSGSGTS